MEERAVTITILTKHRVYLRDYHWQMQFASSELHLPCTSWPWLMIVELESEGRIERIQDAYARAFRRILLWIPLHPELHSFAIQHPIQITAIGLRRFLMMSEDIAGNDSDKGILRDLAIFTNVLFRLGSHVFPVDLSKGRVGFRSRRRYIAAPRPLLSDGTDTLGLETGSPLGATSFDKYVDLKAKQLAKVTADLDRLRNACIADLEQGRNARKKLLELAQLKPSSESLERICILDVRKKSINRDLRRRGTAIEEILRVAAYQIASKRLFAFGSKAYQVPLVTLVVKLLFGSQVPFKSNKILELGFRASAEEVFAATLLLQTYCGWNFSTLMSLRADGVRVAGGLIELTGGFKSKTDDDAAPFAIESKAPGVQQAVELLEWNREMLILHGFLPPEFQGLFVTAKSCRLGGFHPISTLESLIARRCLPRFTLEQVRTQVLYQAGIDRGGIERASRIAGHANIGTTGRYLAQLAADRLNSSSNVEFQRRLESELLYAVDPAQRTLLKDLTSIGDGASCIAPCSPPADRSLGNSECQGELCHSAEGCPNRRIVIDGNRMKEVLRTRVHFQKRHHAMQEANAEHFEKFSLPAIAFNEALHSVLENGPYAGVYARLARELEID